MKEKFATLDTSVPKEEKTTFSIAEEMLKIMKNEMKEMGVLEEKIPEVLKEMEKQLEKPAN